jgi:hypothetical protein
LLYFSMVLLQIRKGFLGYEGLTNRGLSGIIRYRDMRFDNMKVWWYEV